MNNRGEICSIDVSKSRLAYWKKQMQRTKVAIAEAIRADAANPPVQRKVEVAMVDPPCSNSGVFAKNPSIKWRLSPAKVKDYAARQYSLLNASANHVDSHGTLVYCTCSILPEENEFVIENFLRRRQDFQLTAQVPFFGSPGLMGLEKCQRFYPHLHDCDGYFIAKMRRII
jgi:16S rRNA (cytosine967-C5)-methyltransferase